MTKTVKNLKLVLLVSAAALSACATGLANYTPIDIASNSVRRTDAISGMSEVVAPKIKVFSARRASVRGQAQLRTAGPFTDDNDVIYEGGAYLDVSIKYTSPSPNPAEARIYDQASWPGGAPALLADFGATVLNCREDIRAVPSYQYTPIYGAWGFGHIHDDYCGHEYGRDGWGNGYGHYGRGHVHDDNCGHDIDHGSGSNTVVITPTTDRRPVGRPVSRPVSRPVPRPDRPRRPRIARPDGVAPQPDGHGTDPDVRPPRPRRPNTLPIPQPRTVVRPDKKIVSRPRPDIAPSRPYNPANPTVRPPTVRYKPTVQPVPKVVSRPRPEYKPKPEPVSKPKATYKPSVSQPKYTSKPRPQTSDSLRRKFKRQLDYYPRDPYYRGSTDYVVRRRCDRQENLRVFIPRERLDRAEANGLVLYLRPRGGQEEVLSLPPNYITGFKLAAWSPQGPQLTIQGRPLTPIQAAQAPSNPSEPDKPSKPSSSEPIVYGEE